MMIDQYLIEHLVHLKPLTTLAPVQCHVSLGVYYAYRGHVSVVKTLLDMGLVAIDDTDAVRF
jgi:hypothetical protein